MTLESIEQNARSILEMYSQLRELEKRRDADTNGKINLLRNYIIKLAYNIKKLIQEEKEDAG